MCPAERDAFAAAEGDPACGVAERLTRKGWPLAANPWRALRKCNVHGCSKVCDLQFIETRYRSSNASLANAPTESDDKANGGF